LRKKEAKRKIKPTSNSEAKQKRESLNVMSCRKKMVGGKSAKQVRGERGRGGERKGGQPEKQKLTA